MLSMRAEAHALLRVALANSPDQADLIVAIQPNYTGADCRIYFEDQENLADVAIEEETIPGRIDVLVYEQYQTNGADMTIIEDNRYSSADVRVYGTKNLILAAAACPGVNAK